MEPTETETVTGQGAVVDLSSIPADRRVRAFGEVFDYRGDVTLTLEDGSRIECFVFDHREAPGGATLRVIETSTGDKRSVACAGVRRIEFTGKDTAAGKTWENWVRRYVEKHRAGEHAGIESEPLE
jgi:hypothetical protein